MQIIINKSSEISKRAELILKEKLEKLTTIFERIEAANVHLKRDDGQGENEGTISIRLSVPGPDLVAEASEETIEKSIAEVTEKLRRQLKKLKDKNNAR
jgi:putative sigma-54 modulation protein